jgi:hypothetical protein
MLITSMGIFGFLSKAHNDQNLVSGDVTSKIAIYDEKIKTEKENIEANRKALKQMDESVDQSMARSNDEKGADKAVALRRSQAKERARLQQEITAEQKTISALNDEAAPIRAEVRKVEAEVGPLKYIAAFVYGETDETVLEKAVTWVIITIIIVFDPLAVIMLLAAQMTFGWHRKNEQDPLKADAPADSIDKEADTSTGFIAQEVAHVIPEAVLTADQVTWPFPTHNIPKHTEQEVPSETPLTALGGDITATESQTADSLDQWNKMIEEAEKAVEAELDRGEELLKADEQTQAEPIMAEISGDRIKPDLTEVIESEESKKKTYMTKDPQGLIQIKNRL